MSELTHDQLTRELRKCEAAIYDGGEAMRSGFRRIREEKLYRAVCRTWDDYCSSYCHTSKRAIDFIIEGERVFENIAGVLTIEDENGKRFSQKPSDDALRVVKDLPPEQQREVAAEAVAATGNGKLTKKVMQAAKEKVVPKPSPAPRPVADDSLAAAQAARGKLTRAIDTLNERHENVESWRAALGHCESIRLLLENWQ